MTTSAPAALHPARVHPTAIVEDGARLGANVDIGPFSHIGPDVTLGDNVQVMSHVVITGRTMIGDGTIIYPHAVLGCGPQNVHYKGEDTELVVGRNCTIREGVTMHTGMPNHGARTTVGDNCMFLAYAHVAHDCHVGNDVILSNNVMLAGHVTIGERVIMGGGAAIHQFCRVGHHAFIGGLSPVHYDVIPYGMVNGNPGVLMGLNIVGMQRSGIAKAEIHAVRRAYKALFKSTTPIRETVAELRQQTDTNSAVSDILAFIEADSERGLSTPARAQKG